MTRKERSLEELAAAGKQKSYRKSWKTFELEYTMGRLYRISGLAALFGMIALLPISVIIVPLFVDDENALAEKFLGPYIGFLFFQFILMSIASSVVARNPRKLSDAEKDADDAKERKYQRASDVAVSYWSMSSIANFFRANLGVRLVYIVFSTAFLAFVQSYFRFFRTHETVKSYDWKSGLHTKFNPDLHGGYTAFYLFLLFTLPITLYIIALPFAWWQGKQRLRKEKGWLAALPFPVTGYPEVLAGKSDDYMFTVYYKSRRPASDFIRDIAHGVNRKATHTQDSDDGMATDEISIDFQNSWTAQKKSNYKFYRFFHEFTESALLKLHQDYPIAKVRVSYKWD